MTTPAEAFERARPAIERFAAGRLCKKYGQWIELCDIRNLALMGLWTVSLKHFELEPEAFLHVAYRRAIGSLLDHIRGSDWRGRHGYAVQPGTVAQFRYSIGEEKDGNPVGRTIQLAAPEPDEPDDRIPELRRQIALLPPRLAHVIEAYDLKETPQCELAKQMGISAPRISQLRTMALARLRAAMTARDT